MNELVKPADDTLEQVQDWLINNGVEEDILEYSRAKDWIKVTLPVSSVERLLDSKYSVFKHEDGSHVVRTPQWSLPSHLHRHIETIQPTNSFFRPRAKKSTLKKIPIENGVSYQMGAYDSTSGQTVAQACNATAVTPLCLRILYGKGILALALFFLL